MGVRCTTFKKTCKSNLPECLPFLLAAIARRTRDLEWIAVGLRIIKPSFTNFRMFCLEFALPISVVSFGSSQIFLFPHFSTDDANLFCSRRLLHSNEDPQLKHTHPNSSTTLTHSYELHGHQVNTTRSVINLVSFSVRKRAKKQR